MQRRRNYAGHLHLVRKYGYRVSSLETGRVLRIATDEVGKAIRLILTLTSLAMVEAFARLLGTYDYYVKGDKQVVWNIAWTTKQVKQKPSEQSGDSSQQAIANSKE
jgi:hypothetical protein